MEFHVCTASDLELEDRPDPKLERLRDALGEAGAAFDTAMPYCPACGAPPAALVMFPRDLLPDHRGQYSGCLSCAAIWETLPEGEPYTVDDEQMPFAEPCDNCAFRAGSPESRDRKGWRELLAKLKRGGRFYCHKGVPVNHTEGGFDFPYRHQIMTGEPVLQPDESRMRLCRGFLKAWAKWEGIE